jgi:hypothetical protein
MIKKSLSFGLPLPWTDAKFETEEIGCINFLVGPNGSGKSRFAHHLVNYLGDEARILETDRLSGMEQRRHPTIIGDGFASGFSKTSFPQIKNAGREGSGIDTIVLLGERMDLRIQVEATIGDLFNRKINLKWDSGLLFPWVEGAVKYRLDRDECHGIKELVVLLTHLYNGDYRYLIIDEPELNLHPQFQAFFMQEVRKLAGDPTADPKKKVLFLITHSPFILDFRSVEDVKSVISFDLNYSVPKQLPALESSVTKRFSSFVPRLNVHHKQLFFSDNPIFVAGILDAQLIEVMQESRGVSVTAAGSCIIDAGGCEQVNHYLELCMAFGKKAYFLYDLDSLFGGNLRACVKRDGSVKSFALTAGVGNDFSKYCGELETKLTEVIKQLLSPKTVESSLSRLLEFLKGLGPRNSWTNDKWCKARVSVMTAIGRRRSAVVSMTSRTDVEDIEGRLRKVIEALKENNIVLLGSGTLESYLPSYAGDPYKLTDDAKRQAVFAEIEQMKGMTDQQLLDRYGELYEAVHALPGKSSVNL